MVQNVFSAHCTREIQKHTCRDYIMLHKRCVDLPSDIGQRSQRQRNWKTHFYFLKASEYSRLCWIVMSDARNDNSRTLRILAYHFRIKRYLNEENTSDCFNIIAVLFATYPFIVIVNKKIMWYINSHKINRNRIVFEQFISAIWSFFIVTSFYLKIAHKNSQRIISCFWRQDFTWSRYSGKYSGALRFLSRIWTF